MKVVGERLVQDIQIQPDGRLLSMGALHSSVVQQLATTGFPKGVFRYRSHEEANRHQEECLALAMAKIAESRLEGAAVAVERSRG